MNNERQKEELLSAQALALNADRYDIAAAVEAERRRLAALLESGVIESLNLLLTKAHKYGQLLQENEEAQVTVSVLENLARSVLQEARDLQANLNPTTLEALGLEPALEALVAQVNRSSRLHVSLISERMRERLAPPVELAIYRMAQDALEYAVCFGYVSNATLRLETSDDQVMFSFINPCDITGEHALRAATWRVEVLGGQVDTRVDRQSGFELRVSFPLSESSAQLTGREMEVLSLLGEGLSNKEMAERLHVSPRTVNFHLDNIYNKLGVNSRTEAVVYAMRRNWIRSMPLISQAS